MTSTDTKDTTTQAIKKYQLKVEEVLVKNMSNLGKTTQEGGTVLREACEYALLSKGKRFRPVLVYLVADALKKGKDVSLVALVTEYFHTASLIADDLPCMDNDDERRDKPSTHKVFGEATALLSSYALIAAGYGLIATASQSFSNQGNSIVIEALLNASENTGVFGATGGQFLDINPPDFSVATMRDIIHKKTVSLFEISFVFGWLFGGGDVLLLPKVKECASCFGMAFQIVDDLGDREQDIKNGRKINVAGIFGEEKAREMLLKEVEGYKKSLKELCLDSCELMGLADLFLSLN